MNEQSNMTPQKVDTPQYWTLRIKKCNETPDPPQKNSKEWL
jgi:hypothetical protein